MATVQEIQGQVRTRYAAAAVSVSHGCGCGEAGRLEGASSCRVRDLGSGGGIDVLLSARRVGPTGYVYGVDLTPEMLELARDNAAKAGATNLEFLLHAAIIQATKPVGQGAGSR